MRTGEFYEINVSINGKHVFATDSMIRTGLEHNVLKQLKIFKEKFRPEDGYKYSVTCWKVSCPALPDSIKQQLKEIEDASKNSTPKKIIENKVNKKPRKIN